MPKKFVACQEKIVENSKIRRKMNLSHVARYLKRKSLRKYTKHSFGKITRNIDLASEIDEERDNDNVAPFSPLIRRSSFSLRKSISTTEIKEEFSHGGNLSSVSSSSNPCLSRRKNFISFAERSKKNPLIPFQKLLHGRFISCESICEQSLEERVCESSSENSLTDDVNGTKKNLASSAKSKAARVRWYKSLNDLSKIGFHKKITTDGNLDSNKAINSGFKKQKTFKVIRSWAGSKSDLSSAESLGDLLQDKKQVQLFKKFLQQEFSDENLDFYLDVQSYKKVNYEKQQQMAKEIFEKYIKTNSPREINLDATTKMMTIDNMNNPGPLTFDSAQEKIYNLMEYDSFQRFLAANH